MEGLLSVQEKGVLGKKWKKHYVKIVGAEIQIHKGETPGEIQHKIDIGPDVQLSGMVQAKGTFKISHGKEVITFMAELDSYKQWTETLTELFRKVQFPDIVAEKAKSAAKVEEAKLAAKPEEPKPPAKTEETDPTSASADSSAGTDGNQEADAATPPSSPSAAALKRPPPVPPRPVHRDSDPSAGTPVDVPKRAPSIARPTKPPAPLPKPADKPEDTNASPNKKPAGEAPTTTEEQKDSEYVHKRNKSDSVFRGHSKSLNPKDLPIKKSLTIKREDSKPTESKDTEIVRDQSPSPSPIPSLVSVGPDVDRRTKIAHEIVATEQSYVSALETLITYYQQPLREAAIQINVPLDQINSLFPNCLDMIYNFNSQFLKLLEQDVMVKNDTSTIGAIFDKHVPFFKMYTEYSSDYQNCINNYNRLTKENAAFKAELDKCRAASKSKLYFEDYIIMPVQRVPRYNLLLQDLLKHTDESHPDYKKIQESLAKMNEVATKINESVRKSDNAKRIASLEAKGANFDNLILPHRHLVEEALIKVEENKKKETKHFFLFNDILVHIASSQMKGGVDLSLPEYCWPLNLIWSRETEKKTQLIGPNGRTLQVSKKDKDAMALVRSILEAVKNWCQHLNSRDSSMNNNETHRKGKFTFPGDGGTYDGDWEFGVRHGEGTYIFMNTVYEGHWENDKQSGKGKLTYSTGHVYEGDWKNGLQHGKGNLKFGDKIMYSGDWAEGMRSGTGTFYFPNGDVYTGDWHQDKATGQGKLVTTSNVIYEGQWKDNHFEGRGILQLPDGGKYEGQFKAGVRHGKGEMRYASGAVYIGDWSEDVRHGKGEFKDVDGSVYDGEWKDDLQDGKGVKIYANGAKYEGSWSKGVRKGQGVCIYSDGCRYEGHWQDDKRHGQGTFVQKNGTYVGEWVNNRKEGKGIMTYATGARYEGYWAADKFNKYGSFQGSATDLLKSYEGEWLNGKMHGKGTLTLHNGDQYKGTFKDNKFHGYGTYTWAGTGLTLTGKWKEGVREGKAQLFHDKGGKDGFSGTFEQPNCLSTSDVNVFLPLSLPTCPLFIDDYNTSKYN